MEAWSAHWCAARTFNVGRMTERGSALESEGWVPRANCTSVRAPKSASIRLAEAALDLRPGPAALTDRDRRLLDRMAEKLIQDLCERVEAALEVDESFGSNAQPQNWLEISVAEGVGPDLFWIALPVPALAKACCKAVGLAPRLPALGSMAAPLRDIDLLIEATVGRLDLSMLDLADLTPGDVLVLPTRIDQPIEVSLLGSSQVFARARLANQDGELALAFQTGSSVVHS